MVGVEGEVLIVVHVDLGVAGVPQGVAQLSAQPVELGHAAEVTSWKGRGKLTRAADGSREAGTGIGLRGRGKAAGYGAG